MSLKLPVSTIRFFCMIFLPLSSRTQSSMREAELIEWARRSKWLTQEEIASVASRADSRFANRVHNVVSHRDSRMNPIRLRLIERDSVSVAFHLTEKGARFLLAVDEKLGGNGSGQFAAVKQWLLNCAKRKGGT